MDVLSPDDGVELCPFCGSDDQNAHLVAGVWFVRCEVCEGIGPKAATEWTAFFMWNMRGCDEGE